MSIEDGNAGSLDYKIDSLPKFNTELKGNSAEGNLYTPAMSGYGRTAAPARHPQGGGTDAPGAFVQGSNPANSTAAGKPMSGNSVFNPAE